MSWSLTKSFAMLVSQRYDECVVLSDESMMSWNDEGWIGDSVCGSESKLAIGVSVLRTCRRMCRVQKVLRMAVTWQLLMAPTLVSPAWSKEQAKRRGTGQTLEICRIKQW